ncbi:bacterio-opsin activator [Thermoplasmatales archaeon]|nr:bacterio-opsin activator [Thermoplasmatales archaeon]
MITGSFTVKSECSLASVAGALDETVITVSVCPLGKNRNYVFSIVKSKNQEEVEPLLTRDFESYKIHSDSGIVLIQGIKRGHGLMQAIVESGSIPSFPTIARVGVEVLDFMSLTDSAPSRLEESLEAGSHLENFFFDKVSGGELVMDVTKRWGVLGTVNLTDTEKNLIKAAYKRGFFEWPRMYDLDLMKREYNLSKPTLLYHMRNAEKKIMQTIFG